MANSLLEAIADLPQLANAASGLTSTILDNEDRKKQMVADAELRAQQIDLEVFQKEELEKFSKRNDFENFEEEWNADYAKKFDQYNSKSGSDAYTSNYSAMRGNEMFNEMKARADSTLNSLISKKQTDYANQKDFNTIEKINESKPATQETVNEIDSILKTMHSEGRIDDAEYETFAKNQLNKSVYDYAVASMTEKYGEYDSNASFLNALDNLQMPDFSVQKQGHGDEGYTLTADKESLEAAKKTILQDLKDKQYKTNSQIYQANTEILTDVKMGRGTEGELIHKIKTQINYIENLKPLAMADDDRRQRINELMSVLDVYENAKPGDKNTSRAASEKAWDEDFLKTEFSRLIDAGQNGTQSLLPGTESMYAARDAFMDVAEEVYKGTGEGANAAKLDWFNKFTAEAKRKLGDRNLNPKVAGAMDEVERLCKDYTKKDTEKYWPLYSECLEYAWDLVMNTDMSKIDPEEIVKKTEQFMRNTTGKELAILKTESNSIWEYNAESINNLAKGISELQTNDLAWTDAKGKQHINPNAMENVNEEIIPAQVELLYYAGATGDIQIQRTQPTDDKHDIDLNPKYRDAAGNEYEFVSTGEKTFDILKNGTKISDSKDIVTKQKEASKANRAEFKAKRKALKEEQKQLREQRKKTTDAMVKNPTAPQGIMQSEWSSMRPDQRRDSITELYLNDINAYNEYKAKTNK